jgi:hypothetical protein
MPESANCVAHNGSLVPIPGRDVEVQAWYQGGVSIMDFTDAEHPYEIAYFDRGPIDPKTLILGGDWSAYWYNGYIYGSEIARGLDIFKLTPTKFLTQHEIDAANQIHFSELNVQNQQKLVWPPTFLTARAYLDQLERSQALAPEKIAAINQAISASEADHYKKKSMLELHRLAASLNDDASAAKTPADKSDLVALAAILDHPDVKLGK